MKSLLLVLVFVGSQAFAAPAALTVQTLSETAATMNFQDADESNGNYVANPNGDVCFELYNSDVSNSATVTFTAQATSKPVPGYGVMTKANNAVTLAIGARKVVGPFPSAAWNDSNGRVQIAIGGSGAASVSIAPFKVPK